MIHKNFQTHIKKALLLVFVGLFLSGCTLLPQKKSGLQISATPQASVFLNDLSLGLTPILEENLKAGSYTLKVVPLDQSLPPYEAKITLSPGVLTVVDRKIGANSNQSNGYIVSFEKISDKNQTKLAVSSLPDAVTVTLNGSPKGFTPLLLEDLEEGDHVVLLSSPGLKDEIVRIRSVKGYQLNISAQLAQSLVAIDETPTSTPSADLDNLVATASGTQKPYVEVLDTPTGWLRVRSEASSVSEEVAKVEPSKKYPYFQTQSGWHQIEYEKGKKGWVSSQYTKLVK